MARRLTRGRGLHRPTVPVGAPEVAGTLVGALAAAAVLVTGVAWVLARHLDPVSAAVMGGLALMVAEGGVVVGRRRWVRAVGPGTLWARAAVVGGAILGALVIAVVVEAHSRPSRGGVAAGLCAIGALVVVVTMAAARPGVSSDPRNPTAGEGFPAPPG
jgi:hypothetical protein